VTAVGWTVLALVFLDELLAGAAAGVWGAHVGGVVPATLAVATVIAAWALFASPRAHVGGPVVRPVVKVLVFGLASLGLLLAGHPEAAAALLVFSVVVNALAQLGFVQALIAG
jgi:hypothetical protein